MSVTGRAAWAFLAVSAAVLAIGPRPSFAQPQAMSMAAGPATTAATPLLRLIVNGQSASLTASDLRAFTQKTVTFHNAHTKADETYTGVPLTDLLAKYGVPVGDKLHGKPLSDYIVVTGSDGYKAVLALAETDPSFHPGDVIVADTMDGKPIGDKDGPFRLIVTEDKRPARSVHNLVSIELRAAE